MKEKVKLIIITLISVIFMGFALAVLNFVDLGTDPFTYMNLKLSEAIGISFGNWQVILNVILFIPVIIWARKQIGIGTIFNMVLVGYSVEFFTWLLNKIHFAGLVDVFAIRLLVMIQALVIFIFAAATYMSTELGTAPYDAIPFLISNKFPKIKFKWVRLAWDFTSILIGFAVSREIGIVTILMALFLGQTVTFVNKKIMKKS